ncbi:MAG: dienelactone hydrolase family protein [Gemmatimonadales bacterium]|nr:MAG: dienelactone hydrolase family protein [Gemmatimonadales bacterium]
MRRPLSVFLALAAVTTLAAWMVRPRAAAEPHGEWVTFTNAAGDSIPAYIAWPERSDRAPTVLVIHQIFGLTTWETTVVNKLAAQGYVAIAPDLLASKYGKSPANPDSARKLFSGLTSDRILGDLDATAAFVDTLPGAERGNMASIGFCWGGQQSFAYATHNPALKAAVVCYGPAPDSAAMARIQAPILGVYAENDARVDDPLPQVSATMKALGKSFNYDIYPGTGHGFLTPGRKGNDTDQPDKAWDRIFKFYHDRLGS